MTPIFLGRAKNGSMVLDDAQSFADFLRGMDGAEIEIAVRRRRKARSMPLNRYYWAVLVNLISVYTGHSEEETHEALKAHLLIDRSGDEPRIKSTTELDAAQFHEYIDRCIQFASELGISIPAPGQVDAD